MSDFDGFLETFESPNTIKVIRSLRKICEHDYTDCTPMDIQEVILSMKPNSPKAITTMVYVLGLYAKYLDNNNMKNIVDDIDRSVLWSIAKPNAEKKFISKKDFDRIYRDIEMYEEYNALYIQTLFKALYEGIYNDDMSVVKNLRACDVAWGSATLRTDGGISYDITISEGLANDLVKLGDLDIWERKNRYGTCKIQTQGLYKDSCFKVENRKGSAEYAYRYSYYRLLRNVSKNYVGHNLLPLQIYVSGIMYRVSIELDACGINIEDAFADNNKNRKVNKIISDELKQSIYNIEVRNFRELVKGHVDVFC